MWGIFEHICTVIVLIYASAMLYGCFMDYWTNR